MLSRRAAFLAASAILVPRAVRGRSPAPLDAQLVDLMARHRVPGASFALIDNGRIAERFARGADPDTLFQAASISKIVAAIVTLRLVEQGRIGLDTPVNRMLRSWLLPGAGADAVTPRLLLSHRGGTTVPGFAGYRPGEPLPSLEQTLEGVPPANNAAVRVARPPGQRFHYSGGGTMVLQRLAVDAAGAGFDRLADALVLQPAAMLRSGFFQPLPGTERDAASAHDRDGRLLPGRFHVYPEHAAAGLWSTGDDLARLALAIAASWRDGGLLQRATARAMATRVGDGPTGLGPFVQERRGRPPYLYHYGVNAGFRSVLVFAADASFGVALMTNGAGARQVIPDFLAAAFAAAGQDPFEPAP
ncbi:MAG: serine hydrolase domain-containing protein [Pseudomonadota bacterium]